MNARRGYILCPGKGSVHRSAVMWWRLPVIFQGADEMFTWLAQMETIFPVHIVGMELNINCFPDDAIHGSGFGGEEGGVRCAPGCYCASPWLTRADVLGGYVAGAPAYIIQNFWPANYSAFHLLSRWRLARLISPWRWRWYVPLKHGLTFNKLHGVISQ